MKINRVFADNVRRLRRQLRLSQERFAEATGLHHTGLHRTYTGAIERGESNGNEDCGCPQIFAQPVDEAVWRAP